MSERIRESQQDKRDEPVQYEPPRIVASFPKQELEQDLPENLTPHLHAVQAS